MSALSDWKRIVLPTELAQARRRALDEAVKIIMSATEPGERAPASYFAQALEKLANARRQFPLQITTVCPIQISQ